MLDKDNLLKQLAGSFRELFSTLLTDGPVPSEFSEAVECLNKLKAEIGRKETANRLGLSIDELSAFLNCVSDVKKRASVTANDKRSETDQVISLLRMLSWMEAIEQRKPEFQLNENIDVAGF